MVDENIPYGNEAFSQFGAVARVAGEKISNDVVRDADVLIVRSVTKVNEELLSGSAVKLVGTATAGSDHLDGEYLKSQGIAFANAKGCNARSVVEWVLAALAVADERYPDRGWLRNLTKLKLGIVGVGNIGGRLAVQWRALGGCVALCDPVRFAEGTLPDNVELKSLLEMADIVTFHTPLVKDGKHRTRHLVSEEELKVIRERDLLLINASRGPVIDNEKLKNFLMRDHRSVLLDVFEGEPSPMRELIELSEVATPHVAGYSLDGKVNGTMMMADFVARTFGISNSWVPDLPKPEQSMIRFPAGLDYWGKIRWAIFHAYLILRDSQNLKSLSSLSKEELSAGFIRLRKEYPTRWEFRHFQVGKKEAGDFAGKILEKLGFQVVDE